MIKNIIFDIGGIVLEWGNKPLIECSLGIEKQIMKYCKLKPEDINDFSIKEYIEKLKTYNI